VLRLLRTLMPRADETLMQRLQRDR